jgi:protoporphyrinogen oxidase
VIGTGVTGLVAARELARAGWSVEMFERWPDVAGQASAFDVGSGLLVERYYHHLFRNDLEMVALHDEPLPGELEWHRSSVGMFHRGRIWPFTTPRVFSRTRRCRRSTVSGLAWPCFVSRGDATGNWH